MIPTRIHAKVIAGVALKKESPITPTSITAAIMLGIVSLKTNFL